MASAFPAGWRWNTTVTGFYRDLLVWVVMVRKEGSRALTGAAWWRATGCVEGDGDEGTLLGFVEQSVTIGRKFRTHSYRHVHLEGLD